MSTFKIQAVHRTFGYRSPIMFVEAESEGKARNATRLSEFGNEWNIVINNKGDGNTRRVIAPKNLGKRAARRRVRAAAGITTVSRPVRRRAARLASKMQSYKSDSQGRKQPGCAKHW